MIPKQNLEAFDNIHSKQDFEEYLEVLKYSSVCKKTELHCFRHKSEKELKKHFRDFHSNPNQDCEHVLLKKNLEEFDNRHSKQDFEAYLEVLKYSSVYEKKNQNFTLLGLNVKRKLRNISKIFILILIKIVNKVILNQNLEELDKLMELFVNGIRFLVHLSSLNLRNKKDKDFVISIRIIRGNITRLSDNSH